MARISSGSAVAGLTAAALAAVCVLAYQASGSTPHKQKAGPGRPAASAPAGKPSGAPSGARPGAYPVPADSGAGKRVVYALKDRRVWLVDANGEAVRTFKVTPSSVDPPPGKYQVTLRNGRITGSDGVPIEHVVVFGSVGGTVIGFSAAVDGSMPKPDPSRKTGGVRQTRKDGTAMWRFAVIGVKVIVVR